MKQVKFSNLPKMDTDTIGSLLEKHKTNDPQKALDAENIRYKTMAFNKFKRENGTICIADCYTGPGTLKTVYANSSDIIVVVFISESEKVCVCQ